MHNEGQEDMNAPITKKDLREALRPILGFLARLDAKLDRSEARLDAKIDKRYSDTVSHLDAFMAQTLAVRTEQTFLIHRLDKLEGK